MRFTMRICIAPLIVAVFVMSHIESKAMADIIVTSRNSTLTANVVWGNGDGPISFTDTTTETTNAPFVRILGAESGSGESGDIGWASSYQYEVSQDFNTTTNSLELGSSFSIFTNHGDNGVGSVSADNRIIVEFQNTTPNTLLLTGSLTPTSHMLFEQFDGVQWNSIYDTTGSQFNQQFAVGAGAFRISAETSGSVDNFSAGESWSIKVTAVPEPSTLGALVLASGAGYFYRRKSKRTVQSVA